jgi:hypothetical protein
MGRLAERPAAKGAFPRERRRGRARAPLRPLGPWKGAPGARRAAFELPPGLPWASGSDVLARLTRPTAPPATTPARPKRAETVAARSQAKKEETTAAAAPASTPVAKAA